MSTKHTESVDLLTLKVDVPCQFACPAETNVPEYIYSVTKKDYDRTYRLNQAKNIFPGTLGRVCTRPCEDACRHAYPGNGEAVNICRLKRVGGDFKAEIPILKKEKLTGKTVAIVGAGPAGLAAARDLLLLGHRVTMYEAADQLGGMLSLSIPEFRLPRMIIEEDIAPILDLGLKVELKKTLGDQISLDDLTGKYNAVLLALGCQKPYTLGAPGEDLPGVFSGLQFLIDVIEGKKVEVGKKALVIGGGYTAVDCARMLVRMGVEHIRVAYRRTEKEITIDKEEMEHLEMEEVILRWLTTATGFFPDADGKLGQVELARTELVDGRVKLIEGSGRKEDFDTAIICIGQGADGESFISDSYKKYFDRGRLKINENTFMSAKKGLFGAGDYVFATRSIIDSIADGRKAALGIHHYLSNTKAKTPAVNVIDAETTKRKRADDFIKRLHERNHIGKKNPKMALEVNCGLNKTEGNKEGIRCYLCNLHYEIDLNNCIYCMRCIDEAPIDCIKQVKNLGDFVDGQRQYEEAVTWDEMRIIYIDNDICIRCGKCLEVCPTRCISVSKYELVDPIFGDSV